MRRQIHKHNTRQVIHIVGEGLTDYIMKILADIF